MEEGFFPQPLNRLTKSFKLLCVYSGGARGDIKVISFVFSPGGGALLFFITATELTGDFTSWRFIYELHRKVRPERHQRQSVHSSFARLALD